MTWVGSAVSRSTLVGSKLGSDMLTLSKFRGLVLRIDLVEECCSARKKTRKKLRNKYCSWARAGHNADGAQAAKSIGARHLRYGGKRSFE